MKQIIVNDEFDSLRLDKALSLILSDLSRSKIQHFIEDGLVLINQKIAKSSYKLVEGDEISILDFPNEEYHLEAENIPMAQAEVTMIPQTWVELSDEGDIKNMNKTLDLLEEDDDVSNKQPDGTFIKRQMVKDMVN